MKKKTIVLFAILFTMLITVNVTNAKSVLNSKISIIYDNKNKELFAYGYNMQGNLGNGSTDEVKEEDKIKLNEKIGNLKIVDYIFTDAQTFLLTDTGRLFASGYKVGDGDSNNVRTTFKELKLYNSSKIKVTSLKVISNENTCSSILKDKKAKCNLHMKLYTNRTSTYYILNNFKTIYPDTNKVGRWNSTYLLNEYRYNSSASNYLMYREKKSKDTFYETYFNSNRKKIVSFLIDKKKKTITKNNYKNGIIIQSKKMNERMQSITKYKNGYISSKKVYSYKNYKKPKFLVGYLRYTTKQIDYTYKNGKLKQRNIKKFSNKKLRLYSKKFYYPNKKQEFKSNSNGNAYVYTTYYKKGKATITYRYKLNYKGKMVDKKKVKNKYKY